MFPYPFHRGVIRAKFPMTHDFQFWGSPHFGVYRMYDFSEGYTNEDLKAMKYYLDKLEEYIDVGNVELYKELVSEMEERNEIDKESPFKRAVVVPISSYHGRHTSLSVQINNDRAQDKMWLIVTLSDDQVMTELTDYGYTSEGQAVETALQVRDWPVITPD